MKLSFLDLFNSSISASWLVLVVIGLRFLLKKAPKTIHCALWALVAIRLLCPISIESPVSLMPSSETVSHTYLMEPDVHSSGQTVLDIVDNPLYPENINVSIDTAVSRISVWDVKWSAVWLTGMGCMTAYALISWLRLRRKLAASIPIGPKIRLCDHIDSPFILGIFRPMIYLPSDIGQEALDHVLAHEQAHLARKDHWWKPLGFTLLTVHWFNPILWLAYMLLCRDIELACDEKVIRDMDPAQKKAYSAALLDCSVSRPLIAACPLAFGEVGVKERVKNVLNYRKPAFWIIAVSIILCAVAAVCFLTDPPKQEMPTETQPSDAAQPNTDILENGTYISQEKVFWAPPSSLYAYKMEMEVTGNELVIRFNDGEWSEVLSLDGGWQTECPISEKYRALLAELTDLRPDFAMQDLSDCRFLVVNDAHFIVEKDDKMYLVSWNHSSMPLEIINYIFHFVPHSEYEDPSVTIDLGTVNLETDPVEKAILETIRMNNPAEIDDGMACGISYAPLQHVVGCGPAGSTEILYLMVRISTYANDDTFRQVDAMDFYGAIQLATAPNTQPEVVAYWQSNTGTSEELEEKFGEFPQDLETPQISPMDLELECVRQAGLKLGLDAEAITQQLRLEHPEYFDLSTANGLEVYWSDSPDGIFAVITEGSGQAKTEVELNALEPLNSLQTYLILREYIGADITLLHTTNVTVVPRSDQIHPIFAP